MILDTSAIIAILKDEPERAAIDRVLGAADIRRISAATLLELFIVVERSNDRDIAQRADELLILIRPIVEPVTESQVQVARLAYRQYGKGMGDPAQLNFGDCFAYALARDRSEPLLFTGDDFAQTDIRAALARS